MINYDNIQLYSNTISTIDSRSNGEINLETNLFPNLTLSLPVIAAPMKDVCDGIVARIMRECGGFGFIHRFQSKEEQLNMFLESEKLGGCAIGLNDEERFKLFYENGCRYFCLDVANGQSLNVIKETHKYKQLAPDSYFCIGNFGSTKPLHEFCNLGIQNLAIRLGIGPGCFIAGTKVKTSDGYKKIENIKPNDLVLTHDNTYQIVINTTSRIEKERIFDINGIKCTSNHKFYVLDKKYEDIVTDDSIHTYAKWVSAEDLSEEYLLIEATG